MIFLWPWIHEISLRSGIFCGVISKAPSLSICVAYSISVPLILCFLTFVYLQQSLDSRTGNSFLSLLNDSVLRQALELSVRWILWIKWIKSPPVIVFLDVSTPTCFSIKKESSQVIYLLLVKQKVWYIFSSCQKKRKKKKIIRKKKRKRKRVIVKQLFLFN